MAATSVRDEPLSPAGRLFLQPPMDQVINCAIAVDGPFNIDAVKSEVRSSVMLKHPRFCSLMVRDSCGREHWRRTQVDVDRHVIVVDRPISGDDDPTVSDDDVVNDYMADLSVSSPLPTDKPLWEIHLLMARNTAVFRVHHALGDGISLMSMLLSYCRRGDDASVVPTIGGVAPPPRRRRWTVRTVIKVVWYTLVYVLEMVLRALWLRDKKTAVRGGDSVEMWPRRLATARFRLDDMKVVKGAVAHATINDVLFGIVSSGLSRYLDSRSPKALPDGLQITGVAIVNLRPQAGLQDMSKLMDRKSKIRWGNKLGMILLPIYYHRGGSNPIEFVKRAKKMIDRKKLSLEAPLSYKIGKAIISLFGAKFTTFFNYRIMCNTTFTISNIIGPREAITMLGIPVKYIRVTSSSLPHAITMHMVSYAGMADLQILAAKDIIPDPKVLAKCIEDALLEMKEAAETTLK